MKINVAVFFLAIAALAQANVAEEPQSAALRLEMQHKYSEAEQLYLRALEEPHRAALPSIQAYEGLKRIYQAQNKSKELIDLLQQELQDPVIRGNQIETPDHLRVELMLAYRGAGKKSELLEQCKSFLAEEPNSKFWPIVFSFETELYREKGQKQLIVDEAYRAFQSTETFKKSSVAPVLMSMLATNHQYDKSAAIYRQALIEIFHVEEAKNISVSASSDDYRGIAQNFEDLAALAQNTTSYFTMVTSGKQGWARVRKQGLDRLFIDSDRAQVLRIQAQCYEKAGLTLKASEKYSEVLEIAQSWVSARQKLAKAGLNVDGAESDIKFLEEKLRTLRTKSAPYAQ